MITNRDKQMATTLARIENSIYRILSEPEIMARLANYGYDFGAMHSARNLLEEVIRLNRLPDNYDGKERLLLESFRIIKTDFEDSYNRHRRLVQDMNESPVAREAWQRTYPEHPDYEKWLSQADIFYSNLLDNNELKEALKRKDVSEDELLQARHVIDIMRQVIREYRRQKGSENKELVDMEQKIHDLESWYNRFVEINRIAFEAEPQMLEILGISVVMN